MTWSKFGAGLASILLCTPALALRLTVLHTNDLHSHFEGSGPDALFTAKTGDGDPVRGHYARIAGLVRSIREKKKAEGEPVLLFDSGDFFSGSLFHGLAPTLDSPSSPELEFFHELAYDGVTFGNHEFDSGPKGLETMLRKAQIRWGLANVVLTNLQPAEGTALSAIGQEIVKEISDGKEKIRVGILGFTGPAAARDSSTNRGGSRFIGFDDKRAREQAKAFYAFAEYHASRLRREKQVSLVIALIHGGAPEDESLARVPGIDLVLSGHTHKLYESPLRVGKALVAQAGSYGRYLGVLELETAAEGLKLRNAGATHRVVDDSVPADPKLLGLISSYKKEVSSRLRGSGFAYDSPVVTVPRSLAQNRETGEGLGPLVTSAIRAQLNLHADFPVDVYFTSRSLIREDMPAVNEKPTPYQFSDMFRILSIGFGDKFSLGSPVVSATFSREDFVKLLQLLEVYRWISPHFALVFSDSLTFKRNPKGLPFLNRLKDIRLHGKPMEQVGPYIRVATNAYSAAFFPKLSTMSRELIHFQIRDEAGKPTPEFHKEPVPSEPFLLSQFLKEHSL